MITYIRQIEVLSPHFPSLHLLKYIKKCSDESFGVLSSEENSSVVSVRWVTTCLDWAIMFTAVDAAKALWIDTKHKEYSYLYTSYTHVPYLGILCAV